MVDHVQLFFVYSSYQMTSLHLAAHEGHVDIVRYLVDKGADANIKDNRGVSEREYTADCKLVLLVRVCFHSPNHRPLLLIELYSKFWLCLLIKKNKISQHKSWAGQNYSFYGNYKYHSISL